MTNPILFLFFVIPAWITEHIVSLKLYIHYILFGEYKVFLDDERQTPKGWIRTYSVDETIQHLQTGRVTHLSLDNDLGQDEYGNEMKQGFLVVNFLEDQAYNDPSFPIPEITIHSANATRVQYMRKVVERILERRSQ